MDAPKLPFWLSGSEVRKLAAAGERWFRLLEQWAQWPVMQMDPQTCAPSVLNLMAWQRDIDRFEGEPLELFRKRVKYAYINARDAGSVAGFGRIFMRLGIGYVEIDERMPGRDWDVVSVRLSDSQLAENQRLLDVLIQHYGRTCRRYEWTVMTPETLRMRVTEFNNDVVTVSAAVPPLALRLGLVEFGHDSQTMHT